MRRNSAGNDRYDYQEQGYGAQGDRVCGVYLEQHAGEQARLATSALNGALGAVLTAGHPENSWL